MPPFRGFLGLAIVMCGACLVRLLVSGLPVVGSFIAEVGQVMERDASEPWLAAALLILLVPAMATGLSRIVRRRRGDRAQVRCVPRR